MTTVLLGIVEKALSIWDHKEKHKYAEEFRGIKGAIYEEQNKDPALRSDAVLDQLEFKLRIFTIAFTSVLGESNPPNKP